MALDDLLSVEMVRQTCSRTPTSLCHVGLLVSEKHDRFTLDGAEDHVGGFWAREADNETSDAACRSDQFEATFLLQAVG